jgi:hypothetical protein
MANTQGLDGIADMDPASMEVARSIVRVIVDHLRVSPGQAAPGEYYVPNFSHDGGNWSRNQFDFTGATIIDADFAGVVFHKPARFSKAIFVGENNFREARFRADANFSSCVISPNATLNFFDCFPASKMNFDLARVEIGASLYFDSQSDSTYYWLDCNDATVLGHAVFGAPKFNPPDRRWRFTRATVSENGTLELTTSSYVTLPGEVREYPSVEIGDNRVAQGGRIEIARRLVPHCYIEPAHGLRWRCTDLPDAQAVWVKLGVNSHGEKETVRYVDWRDTQESDDLYFEDRARP